MKNSRTFLFSAIVIFLFCAPAFGQKELPALAADADLAATEAWLLKVLGKNSTYHVGPTKKTITDLKFDGCSVSYTMRAETYQIADGALPTDSGEERGDLSSKASGDDDDISLGRNGAATIGFSFADMNPETVAVGAARDSNKMKIVVVESAAGKNAVKVGAKGRSNKSVERPSITLTIKESVAEPVKNGLVQAIKLCQSPK